LKRNYYSPIANDTENREVLLVFPGKFKSPNPQVPLSLLHLASFLLNDGFHVRLLDLRLEKIDQSKIGKPFFVGISCIHSSQISFGLEFARKVRETDPSIPIIWGGVHPTLLPEQTASSKFVDIVVRGEGEMTIVELARKLKANQPLDSVKGITYKKGKKIDSTPDRPLIDLDTIPIDLPYDLLLLDKYPTLKAGRFHIQTSRGCPHLCGFCYNTVYNKHLWRGKSSKRVVDEIEFILKKFPDTSIIDPIDDNFFVDEQRVQGICREIIKRGLNVKWRANCRFDYMAKYNEEFIKLLEKSGCKEVDFGGESGSDRLQTLINKEITSSQIVKSVENLKNWAPSIEPYVSWMCGLPTETDEDLKKTCDLMDKMSEINPKTQHYGIFLYTPFPSPILDTLKPTFVPPQSFDEWGNAEMFHFSPPWHKRKYVKRLQAISLVSIYAFYPDARIKERGIPYRIGYGVLNKIAKYRWKKRFFSFPIELQIATATLRKRREYL
jgi:anaerobic magnesium-protoporphyrin IX monomethyl ester cyclase